MRGLGTTSAPAELAQLGASLERALHVVTKVQLAVIATAAARATVEPPAPTTPVQDADAAE